METKKSQWDKGHPVDLERNSRVSRWFRTRYELFVSRCVALRRIKFFLLGKMSFENPHLFIGEPTPKFTAVAIHNGDFIDIDLDTYKGKYLCLIFYPADFSFVCPTELVAFSDKLEDFRKIECELLAISCDSQYSHLAWWDASDLRRTMSTFHKARAPARCTIPATHWISFSLEKWQPFNSAPNDLKKNFDFKF